MFKILKKKQRVCCPDCKQWYAADSMVVVNYQQPNQFEVCIGCYEDKYFEPWETLQKGD